MIKRLVTLFAAALFSVTSASACGGVQQELEKRAQEEVEKRRQQVEQKVEEERRKAGKKGREGRQRVEEEVKKAPETGGQETVVRPRPPTQGL
jgi:LPS O-antigen subunit length determinant protein (WzzB/FepE family)